MIELHRKIRQNFSTNLFLLYATPAQFLFLKSTFNTTNKKFNIFNDKILNSAGLLKENKVKDIVIDLGYDYQKVEDAIKKDSITNVLNQDLDLANKLELRGTPAFIIKDQIYFGYVGYDAMAESLKN